MSAVGKVVAIVACVIAMTAMCVVSAQADATPRAPRVSGPLTGGVHDRPWAATSFDPGDFGYAEREYLVSGTAHAYGTSRPDVPFVTRMLVYRPTDPTRFSGNVTVEWTNVTGQIDHPFEFNWLNRQAFANGDAYVVVSAQQTGACGLLLNGQPMIPVGPYKVPPCTPISLKGWDPVRYGSLWVPDDDYAFDIFSQAGSTLRNTTGVRPLGGLVPKKLVAIGLSQSAMMLDKYIIRGADDAAKVYDGFIVDSEVQGELPQRYRVPTIHLWSEESGQIGVPTSGANHRIWSIAGAAHVDGYNVRQTIELILNNITAHPRITRAQYDQSVAASENYGQQGPGLGLTCAGSSQFQRRYAVDAAVAAMQEWVSTGTPAPVAKPFRYTGFKQAVEDIPFSITVPILAGGGFDATRLLATPFALERDSYGNAIGGVRLPQIAAPVASYHGSLCSLFGITVPFAPTELSRLYPTHAVYVEKMLATTRKSVRERFMTRVDGLDQMRLACASAIPGWGTTPPNRQPKVCRSLHNAL
ncbi:alpha/beta hydrolase domain-containing protein [Gordonia rhizosphera]|uniref:Alpha/beta hydrolase domain-containing protein n=1 Tax=Gordonia rhizosphera NBRC 16068 TaxID=1108045 RepID=K6WD68_9ACTN|nr:alpha/beta hydrolase domain-containing protein [Gordonia rhizosphera]GAB91676.1 hypothetical protein GORHZ_141_00510 [Gordonia rhizosphera NBRC 16068]